MFSKMNNKGTANATVVIVIVLIFYLVGLGFLLNAIGRDLPSVSINTKNQSLSINGNINGERCDCGVIACSEYKLIHGETALNQLCASQNSNSFFGNIITGINDCPLWMNTMFILIPVLLLITLIILVWLHG